MQISVLHTMLIFLGVIAISSAKPSGKAPPPGLQGMLLKLFQPDSQIKTLEQLKAMILQDGFKSVDENGDGKLSKAEHLEWYKKYGQVTPGEIQPAVLAEIAANFTREDKDKDGFLDLGEAADSITKEDEKELLNALEAQKTVQEEMKKINDMADLNGDGKVAKAEFVEKLKKQNSHHLSEADIAQMFDKIDKNNDGFVDIEDIVAEALSHI